MSGKSIKKMIDFKIFWKDFFGFLDFLNYFLDFRIFPDFSGFSRIFIFLVPILI